MRATKELGVLLQEDGVGTSGVNSRFPTCSTDQERRWSVSGVCGDILNITPRPSCHNPAICIGRTLNEFSSLHFPQKEMDITSNEIPLEKPTAELVEEIAALEVEVIQLERHLLSLYRTAFDLYLPCPPTVINHASRSLSECLSGPLRSDEKIWAVHKVAGCDKVNQSYGSAEIEEVIQNHRLAKSSAQFFLKTDSSNCCTSPKQSPQQDIFGTVSSHRSLADHLGASITDHMPDNHCKLSEDIVRCISAIYCKLANSHMQPVDTLASPSSSMSSSSMSSPPDTGDTWSPQCQCEGAGSPYKSELLKNKQTPYCSMVEVPKICVDGDTFDYASKMLGIFRSLVRRLDKIDPRKMELEMQLAFWINIHNALVMHAFLAYGFHENHVRSTSLIMKAVYNIGGHSVNAYDIQKGILGCQLHRPALSLRTLFSPVVKYMVGNFKHAYALDRPEPLAHFALCLGAYPDPAVRVYTAKGVYQELNLAKTEFIRSNVSVRKETRIILPKVLQYYVKDTSLELFDLLMMVCDCMPETQQKVIQGCLRKNVDKCIEWSPYRLAFRYLLHRDLAKC